MAKILLVRPSMLSEMNIEVSHPLGILYLAAVLREKGHDVRLQDLRIEPDGFAAFARLLSGFRPDVVGISALTVEHVQVNRLAAEVKRMSRDLPVVLGGPHGTSYPEKALSNPDLDVVVIGEGEKTILELMPCLERGDLPRDVKGVAYREDGRVVINERQDFIEDLDNLPFPAWDLLDLKAYARVKAMSTLNPRPYMTMFTSRSCPYGCIYCHQVFGKGHRKRSADNVLAEMETIIRTYGIRHFEIVDDIFNLDKERAQAICDGVLARSWDVGFAFPNGMRADILTPELIRSLRRAGTVSASFAVETATSRLQKLIRKNLNLEKAAEAINYASELGIISTGFFMLGFPTETRDEVLRTIRFASALKLHTALFFLVTPFLGTDMAALFKEKYPEIEKDFTDFDYNKGDYNLSEVETRELFRLQRYANLRFYFNPTRMVRILRDHPDKRRLLARAVKMVRFKILTPRRGSFAETPG